MPTQSVLERRRIVAELERREVLARAERHIALAQTLEGKDIPAELVMSIKRDLARYRGAGYAERRPSYAAVRR